MYLYKRKKREEIPCPYCGSTLKMENFPSGWNDVIAYRHKCTGCGFRIPNRESAEQSSRLAKLTFYVSSTVKMEQFVVHVLSRLCPKSEYKWIEYKDEEELRSKAGEDWNIHNFRYIVSGDKRALIYRYKDEQQS